MIKMVKLPLFLSVCGVTCATILATVFTLTHPIIEKTKQENAAKSYVFLYQDYDVKTSDIVVEDTTSLSDDLFNIGCSSRAIIIKAKGIAYTCHVSGYASTPISFQVAFAEGKYIGYADLENEETAGFGKDLISSMPSLIKNLSAKSNLLNNDEYLQAISGKSTTGRAIAKAIEICRVDYLNWYLNQK